jgi:chemotaxis signal transduction protein
MLPVLDLRPLLDAAPLPLAGSARLVVVARDDLVVGLLAEAVPGVYDEPLSDVAAPPPTLSADAARLVSGQVSDAFGPVGVLDVAAVLALRERVDRRRHGA